jgi:hypothetical protein
VLPSGCTHSTWLHGNEVRTTWHCFRDIALCLHEVIYCRKSDR